MTSPELTHPVPPTRLDDEEVANLEEVWTDRPGLYGFLATVDHKRIATRYIVSAFFFFALAGVGALMMRTQLALPENRLLGPDFYRQVFTVHGTTMMFIFAVPVMQAVGLYLVPLMIGTRNVAFPRLNALGFWVYLIGSLLLWVSFFMNTGPDAGWFSYVPLAGPEYGPGKRSDVWAQTITFTEISAIISAIEIIVTVFKQRAPGMTLNRVPLFVWAMVVTSFMVLFAMPTVATASAMLALDRLVGTHFFNVAEGGDPLLWQHLFWFFGHPEVYIIFIPATGLISSMLPALTRREVFGYPLILMALVGTAFMSFGLWVHHMFAAGIPMLGGSFFTAASVMIAIPTGVQIFCWIATIWTGRPRLTVAMHYLLGFFFIFVIGGMTGVMIASVPLDWQLHDSFFIVAHFHYVLIGGAVFPLLGAVHHWFPKVTGRMMSEKLGRIAFWFTFAGMNITFFPMHFLGIYGMPRRVYTYLDGLGWNGLNLTATIGSYILAVGVLLFVFNAVRSRLAGAPASADPWGADTLEWATSSPPPSYAFANIPIVHGRSPMWTREPGEGAVTGLDSKESLDEQQRMTLITSVIDARPDGRHKDPNPTILPMLAGLAIGGALIACLFTPWGLPIGSVLVLIPLLLWGYPHKPAAEAEVE
ncbi:MAG TPA: cytochrome c oxidase subunit I [Longimicrobiales bacterium]